MRPVQGSQSTGGWSGTQLNWAVRTGNLIPENSYAVAQAHLCGGIGLYPSPSATWFQLAPDVLVVPVVLISWIKTQPLAGPASEQDFLARGRALIDYIPFKGSNINSAPNPWNAADTAAPELWYEPPDDIWTQCGIQFQVVAGFKFDAEHESSPCDPNPQVMEFAEEASIRDLVAAAIGEPAKALLLDELQPAFAEFGFAHCSNYRGKTSKNVHAQIDREDSDQATVLAHELGHVLLGAGHVSDPANLMCGAQPCNGHTLTPNDCSVARTKAAEFAERFRTYNRKLGRVPSSNPLTPLYPDPSIQDPAVVSFQWTCCENGGGKYWAPMMMCPGTALPDAACTECCVVSENPLAVQFMRLGSCGGATLAADQCTLVCCGAGAGAGFVAKAECLASGGIPLEREYCL
ncbi:MAG: hypothetical protein IPI67_30090 [Myxococcales bacterium]|nr:hypothetical protein [Myxococcales bacterium]